MSLPSRFRRRRPEADTATDGGTVLTAPVRGALWMIAAAASFSLMSWAIRALAPIGPSEVVFLRSLFGLAMVVPALPVPLRSLLKPSHPRMFMGRAVLSYIAMVAWFYALQHVVLADAVALQFTLPLFTILFITLVYREPVGIRRTIATLVGFGGALVIVRPGFAQVQPDVLLVLFSAAVYASANVIIKGLMRTERASVVLFYLHALTLPLALLGAIPYWIWPDWSDLPWIVLLAAAGSGAHYCFPRALASADAAIVMPFDYLRLPMLALIGYLAYGEVATVWTWIGAAIICAATFYIVRREARLARAKAAEG